MLRKYCVLLFAIAFMITAYGQNNGSLITADYKDLSITEFVKSIEAQSNYFFYYDSLQLDSIKITINVKDQPLERVLENAFRKTDVQFSIDRLNHVFLTRKIKILTMLPPAFYGKETDQNATAAETIGNWKEKPKVVKQGAESKLYEIGPKTNNPLPGNYILTGYIKNSKTGEPIINATIFLEKLQRGIATDQYGHYAISLPTGNHLLEVQAIGLKDGKYQVMIYGDGRLDIELAEQVNTLKTVVVSTRKISNINSLQLGVERVNITRIKKVPSVFGEADVLRVVLTLPGVKTVGEASTGFNVRGGSTDQNLILYNDGTIFNPSHFFGLFSAFNPDIVKDIQLYKSSIPAKYGGRLSSVLDITTREGNNKTITGSAGLGIITSRFNIEGPIVKDKTSFLFGARTTYANWLLNLLPDNYKNSRASFYDANLGISHHADAKNDFYLSAYISNDHFNLASDTTYQYSNRDVSLKWKHTFNNKLGGVFTAGTDQYKYNVKSTRNQVNAFDMAFDINQVNFKADFTYYVNPQHTITTGVNSIHYLLHPGSFLPVGKQSLVAPDIVPGEQALESAIYISDKYTLSTTFSIDAGIRYSMYNYLGPKDVNIYAPGLPLNEVNLLETKTYGSGAFIKTYSAPEYRLAFRYAFSNSFSIKGGYNSLNQYIHMLSNTTAIAPTDIWKLSDPNIKPQQGDQVSFGLYKNLKSNTIETSVEVYYKHLKNYLDYKPGASLVLNHTIETEVISTKGRAYGVELMIKKDAGKLNGWINYTYSRILLQSDDPLNGTIVNNGKEYPANYDIPHSVTMVGNFSINHRFSISVNTTYNTGRPITIPVGQYYYSGSQRVLYSGRNEYRIPDYFRTDFSMNIDGNHKVHQRTHNSWTIGLYNATGRKNPYSVFFVSENGIVNGYKLSIFGSVIPFINFNIKF